MAYFLQQTVAVERMQPLSFAHVYVAQLGFQTTEYPLISKSSTWICINNIFLDRLF